MIGLTCCFHICKWFVSASVPCMTRQRVADEDDDLDSAYELLGLEDDAGEKEIKAQWDDLDISGEGR